MDDFKVVDSDQIWETAVPESHYALECHPKLKMEEQL